MITTTTAVLDQRESELVEFSLTRMISFTKREIRRVDRNGRDDVSAKLVRSLAEYEALLGKIRRGVA